MTGLAVVTSSLTIIKIAVAALLLLLTIGHLFYRAFQLRRSRQVPAIAISACVMLLLLLGLGIAHIYSSTWRQIAREYGFYESRRPLQRLVTAVVLCGVPPLGVLAGLWAGGWRVYAAGVMALSCLLLALAVTKVISYHPVDAVMQIELILGIDLFEAVFGVGLIGVNVCLFQCVEDDFED
ncbi:hypothetical protein [Blastopirellula marina]|uniref:Uncharacterized protein n=1 Tax=Blastopirellula marina TaxID=124 RepID=A0A2S8F9E8_9BACT|nr:hypothetical protein [Blastopirellula marina]PQO28760.1 hypothetical protein C5Y98_23555 [Blastopirellula marina]PTL42033.1 hypothetical protein C5Y97_23570 [Blastopirellula marina]